MAQQPQSWKGGGRLGELSRPAADIRAHRKGGNTWYAMPPWGLLSLPIKPQRELPRGCELDCRGAKAACRAAAAGTVNVLAAQNIVRNHSTAHLVWAVWCQHSHVVIIPPPPVVQQCHANKGRSTAAQRPVSNKLQQEINKEGVCLWADCMIC